MIDNEIIHRLSLTPGHSDRSEHQQPILLLVADVADLQKWYFSLAGHVDQYVVGVV